MIWGYFVRISGVGTHFSFGMEYTRVLFFFGRRKLMHTPYKAGNALLPCKDVVFLRRLGLRSIPSTRVWSNTEIISCGSTLEVRPVLEHFS
jgi:hypothetical protein